MELNKCKRCGAFFASNDSVCPNCKPKDLSDLSKLKGFLQENDLPSSIDVLSYETGISIKNLNRILESKELLDISKNFNTNNNGNVSINL